MLIGLLWGGRGEGGLIGLPHYIYCWLEHLRFLGFIFMFRIVGCICFTFLLFNVWGNSPASFSLNTKLRVSFSSGRDRVRRHDWLSSSGA